jgi:hypothetical protein
LAGESGIERLTTAVAITDALIEAESPDAVAMTVRALSESQARDALIMLVLRLRRDLPEVGDAEA